MRDCIELGSCPSGEEKPIEWDTRNEYHAKHKAECRRYLELLETMFPDSEHSLCYFRVKRFHNHGQDVIWYEVVISFDDENQESVEFAFNVERNLPQTWENPAILATVARTGNLEHFKGYRYPENDPFL